MFNLFYVSARALPLAPPAGPAAYAAEITVSGVADSDADRRRLSRISATHAVRGMMFDVTATAPHAVTLDRLDLNLLHGGEAMHCTLYVKKAAGPWMGSARVPENWEEVVRREVVSAGRPRRRWKLRHLFYPRRRQQEIRGRTPWR